MRALAVLLVLAAPALAADKPAARPTRDVDVTYVADAGGHAVQQRTRFSATGGMRIDTPSPGVYMLIDRAAQMMTMVTESDRGAIDMPYDSARGGGPAEDADFRKTGADTIAGLGCTDWATTDTAGRQIVACLTPDGVMLRARLDGRVLVQAKSVVYGTLNPAIFAVPAEYRRRALPRSR